MPDVTPRRTKAKPANVSTRRPRLGRPELNAKLEAPVARTGRQRPWQEWYLAIRVKNVLESHGLTLEEARGLSDASLLRLRGIGRKILAAIRAGGPDDATLKVDT